MFNAWVTNLLHQQHLKEVVKGQLLSPTDKQQIPLRNSTQQEETSHYVEYSCTSILCTDPLVTLHCVYTTGTYKSACMRSIHSMSMKVRMQTVQTNRTEMLSTSIIPDMVQAELGGL